MLGDSIGAIATPLGEGGIGIVRISGEMAIQAVKGIFQPAYKKNLETVPSHTIHLGYIKNPKSDDKIDEVLVLIMRGPRSFTGEDVVEIHCHGGIVPLRKTLELVLASGVRLAEPGEFAKRAFLNGRLDLAQAESIIDIIRAKTEEGLSVAVDQLAGRLSDQIKELRSKLVGLLALIEANIDFPEEDVEEAANEKIYQEIYKIKPEIEELIRESESGKILREGLKTVIIGKPNVGKSSLLNALLKEKRAIVTEIPGTTRDVIEEMVDLDGIPIRLVDTAGIRETEDQVEKIGVERSLESISKADLILLVLDRSEKLNEEDKDVIAAIENKKAIILINKSDLQREALDEKELKKLVGDRPVLYISAKEETGLNQIASQIRSLVMSGNVHQKERPLVSNIRHKQALVKVDGYLSETLEGIKEGVSLDCLAIDIRGAWEALGEITGETIGEDILDEIFSRFCIGK